MQEESMSARLRALASNLASLWNGGRPILDQLVDAAGDPRLSPFGALDRLGESGVRQLFSTGVECQGVKDADERLNRYLATETWFDRHRAVDAELAHLSSHPVAYFCMEFGLASWLPIYSGGLGVLAGDMLKEASDLGLPIVGVGMLYRRGFFYQHLGQDYRQTEIIPDLDPATLPLVTACDTSGKEVIVEVPVADRTVFVKAWRLQVGRVPLYLLDTDIPENERPEDRAITETLYGGDQATRIQQEIVLGIGGVRVLNRLGISPSIFSMNEGHAAFLGLELIEELLPHADLNGALTTTRSRVVYTNHTVVPAGNDVFPRELVGQYLAGFAAESGLTVDQIVGLGTQKRDDWFQMALLAFALSGRANAVSELHAEVLAREWPDFAVEGVTNGVHVPTWLGPDVRTLIEAHVPDWQSDNPNWDAIHSIPDADLQRARTAQRRSLLQFVTSRIPEMQLDPEALTVVWARRFAEYKRAWLVASDVERLARMLTPEDRPVQIIIAGKSHPKDETGKQVMQALLQRIDENPDLAHKIVFIEDYDEQVARYLTLGADVWLNTPRKPLEASGTSGMKSSDNGGLQLTVTDGWAAEVDWWNVGWGIEGRDDAADAQELYGFLEQGVIPTFYRRDADGIAHDWAGMMKNTMHVTLSRYSTRRMLLDYLHKLYMPLLEEQHEGAGIE